MTAGFVLLLVALAGLVWLILAAGMSWLGLAVVLAVAVVCLGHRMLADVERWPG